MFLATKKVRRKGLHAVQRKNARNKFPENHLTNKNRESWTCIKTDDNHKRALCHSETGSNDKALR